MLLQIEHRRFDDFLLLTCIYGFARLTERTRRAGLDFAEHKRIIIFGDQIDLAADFVHVAVGNGEAVFFVISGGNVFAALS